MEKLFYDLSEAEFSKSRKVLIWIMAAMFFLIGLWELFSNLVLGQVAFSTSLAIIPFLISLFMGLIALFATVKRKDHFFIVDEEKIEFKNCIIRPKKHTFLWNNIEKVHLPKNKKNAKLFFKGGTNFEINLMWIDKKKATTIRKYIYCYAKEKAIDIIKM